MDLAELEENLALFDDWMERYQYIIALGGQLPALSDAYKTDEYKVRGCISQVWLKSTVVDGPPRTLTFDGDSDSAIVKGLVAILRIVLSGQEPREILQTDLRAIFARVGLEQHLSPNRRNGFFSMVERVQREAAAIEGSSV